MSADSRLRVVVAGGGVAGLEALLALRDLVGDRVELTLVEPETEFRFRPMAIAATFGRGRVSRLSMTKLASDVGAQLLHARLRGVDDDGASALFDDGESLPFDALLVAVGARSEPAYSRAITWTPESDPEVFGGLRRDVEEGYSERIAFVVPPSVAWPLPAYELALMMAWDVRSMGHDNVDVTLVTHESAPLEAFGEAGSAAVRADLDEAGVTLLTDSVAEERDGRLVIQPGDRRLDGHRVVALPRASGPAIDGLTADERGFLVVDEHGKVEGAERTWAAGDAIAFPVKQGGLAAQQADAAAEAIAALAGADVEPKPFTPVLRGVLLTGRGREWMRNVLAPDTGEAATDRHALWWPPTKVAGRYLSPYLAAHEGGEAQPDETPPGQPVELDLS